jgi:predicted Zn finger-like uncharacterized protein
MRVNCLQCGAIYSIAEKIIGSTGRMLKCARCEHTWKVHPPKENSYDNVKPPIPSLQPKHNYHFKIILAALIALSIGLSFVIFSKHLIKYNTFKQIYSYFDIHDTKHIKIENFTLTMEGQDAVITGALFNDSDHECKSPKIRYILLDKDKQVLFRFTASPAENTIKPQERIILNTKISKISAPAKYLYIDAGNDLDLFLR